MEYSDIVEKIRFNNIEELFSLLSPFGKYKNLLSGHVFRGESSGTYKLIPSSLRMNNKDNLYAMSGLGKPIDNQSEWEYWQVRAEYNLLREFFIHSDNNGLRLPNVQRIRDGFNEILGITEIGFSYSEVWLPKDIRELAALAQHYGIPSRLLDWSYDHFTALYFAAKGALSKKNNDDVMVLWVLNTSFLSFLSHTVDKIPLVLVKPPYYDNPNLYAQQGVLTFWETKTPTQQDIMLGVKLVDRTPLDELLYKSTVERNLEDLRKQEFYPLMNQ